MKVHWKVFTDTKKEKNARNIFNRISKNLLNPVFFWKIEEYFKNNTKIIYLYTEHKTVDWKYLVYEVLENAQQIGKNWILYGNIADDYEGVSNASNITGIVQIQFHLQKKDTLKKYLVK